MLYSISVFDVLLLPFAGGYFGKWSIQMGIKGLRVAHEQLGSERDPNAPHNRPKFLDQDAAPAHAAGGNIPGQRLGQEGFNEGQEVRSRPLA